MDEEAVKTLPLLIFGRYMRIDENKDLRPYHTFHLDVKAKYFVEVQSTDDLLQLLSSSLYKNNPTLVLGGGSNLLFTGDLNGLVIKLSLKGIEVVSEDADQVVLKAAAGENWHELVMHCVAQGYGGLENLSLIPGTVGAAPMQNIGAYGVEIRDVFQSLEAIEIETGQIATFNREGCKFGYRESVFKTALKGQFIITSVTMLLSKRPVVNIGYGAVSDTLATWGIVNPTIADVSKAVVHIRQSKLPDPDKIGNAGSFFKNPTVSASKYDALKNNFPEAPGYPQPDGKVKVPAAWLIEQDGWKGKTLGAIGVHPHQALVLVNYGEGKGRDIWELAESIRASVKKRFGIALTPEVNIV